MTRNIAGTRLLEDILSLPAEEIGEALRAHGLLPGTGTLEPVPADRIDAPALGPVVTHIDPRRMHLDGRASVVGLVASQVITHNPELRMGQANRKGELYLGFSALPANSAGLASVRLGLLAPASTAVHISATGNPVVMVLTKGTTTTAVTVQVPFVTSPQGSVGVQVISAAPSDHFVWSSCDIRMN